MTAKYILAVMTAKYIWVVITTKYVLGCYDNEICLASDGVTTNYTN